MMDAYHDGTTVFKSIFWHRVQVLYKVLHGVVYIDHLLEKIKNLLDMDLITWDFEKTRPH